MYIWRHTCDVHAACTWYLHEWSLTTTYIPVMHIGFKSMSHRKYYSSYMWTLSSCHTICRAAMPLSDYLIILWLHFLVKRCYVRVCVCTYNLCVCGGIMSLSYYLIILLLHFLVKRCCKIGLHCCKSASVLSVCVMSLWCYCPIQLVDTTYLI